MLHLAVMLGFAKLTAMLVQLGIDVDYQDRNGMTALHFASWTGKHDIVDILLDQGDANPCLVSIQGKKPIDLAANSNHTGIVDTLTWYEGAYADDDDDETSLSDHVDEQERVIGWLSGKEIDQDDSDEEIVSALATDKMDEPIKPHEPQEPARHRHFSDLTAWMQRSFGNKHKASLIPNSYPPNFLSGNSKLTTDEQTSLLATAWYLAIASMINSSPRPSHKIPSHFVPMDLSIPGAALSPQNVIDLDDSDLDEEDFDPYDRFEGDHLHFQQDTRLQLFWLPLLLLMITVLVCQYAQVDPISMVKSVILTQVLAQ